MNRLEKIGTIVTTLDPYFVNKLEKEIKESDLSDREKDIIIKRLFSDMSLEELSKEYKVTRERIRQIQVKGTMKIRKQIMRKRLEEIINPTENLKITYSEEMEKTDLEILRLPLSIENKLKKAGITNLKTIIETDKEDIQKIKGIGPLSYQLIEAAVDDILLQELVK